MSISPTGRILPQAPSVRPQTSTQSGFSVPSEPAETAAPRAASVAVGRGEAVGAALMLALQECTTAEVSDREARQHGKLLLAALAELQRALLSGQGARALDTLSRLTDVIPDTGDKALGQVLRAIQLRARVEIARAEAAGRQPVHGP